MLNADETTKKIYFSNNFSKESDIIFGEIINRIYLLLDESVMLYIEIYFYLQANICFLNKSSYLFKNHLYLMHLMQGLHK